MRSSVELAVADLSERLQIGPERVTVLGTESVVWPDASHGCPQPGMQYVQVPVDGVRIRLAVASVIYAYHAGGDRREPFLCEQTRTREPEGRIDPDLQDLEEDS